MIHSFPLEWPVGQQRTAAPQRSRFENKTITVCKKALVDEVSRMAGTIAAIEMVLSTNIPLRQDGEFRADYTKKTITDKGVSVFFERNGKKLCFACDRWQTVEENIWAIVKSLENMRGLERWGVSEMSDRAFTGFAQIEAPKPLDIWKVLGFINPIKNLQVIEAAYKHLSKRRHPDMPGGSHEAFTELQNAYNAAIKYANN